MEIASAYVSLLPSAKGFGSKLNGAVGGDIDKAGRQGGARYGKVFASASMSPIRAIGTAAVALFAVAKVKDFFASSIGEAREAQKVGALTAQVIKTTGGAANVSAKQIGNLATAISNKTGIDDEAIQSGENMLLTFTNVRNEVGRGNKVFNQATRLSTDMAAALGTDGKAAALQLGKALNDPAKGVTRLARSGVQFTEQQTKQIKAMQESGDILGAQKIILGEVSREFGGAAAAQATAGEKMSVAWGNLKEQIGTALLPVLDKLEGAITAKVIPAISSFVTWAGPALGRFGDFLAPIVGKVRSFVDDVGNAFGFLFDRGSLGDRVDGFAEVLDHAFGNTGNLVGPLRQVGTVILQVVAGFSRMIDTFKGGDVLNGGIVGFFENVGIFGRQAVVVFQQFGAQAIAIFQTQVVPVLQQAATTFRSVILPAIVSLVSYVATSLWPVLLQIAGIIRGNVIPIIASLASFLYGTLYPAVVRIVMAIAQNLKPVFDQLVATFRGSVLPSLQLILARFREWQPTIQRVIGVLVQVIGKVLTFAAAVLGRVLPVVIKFAGWLLTKLVPAILNTIEVIARIIGAAIKIGVAFAQAVVGVTKFYIAVYKKIGQAIKVVAELPGKAASALGDLSRTLYNSGVALLQGFAQGIIDKGRAVYDAAKGVLDKVRNLFPHSPAKEGPFSGKGWTLHSGVALMTGLADGISRSKGKVRSAIMQVLDAVRQQVQQVTSSVSQAFGGDLFSATNAVSFVRNLTATTGMVGRLKSAFAKLMKWGWRPEALSALFQSGNSGLILSLASSQALATQAAHQYQSAQAGLSSLGATVANNQYALGQDRTLKKFDDLINAVKSVGIDVGSEINGAAKKGKKKRR